LDKRRPFRENPRRKALCRATPTATWLPCPSVARRVRTSLMEDQE